jgi:hypothetical protein
LVVQATSATAALIASSVTAALVASAASATADPETYQAYASAFVLATGLVFLVAGLARLGFITQFLSKPVMDGFVMGLALFVAVGQLNKLFGVPKPEGNTGGFWHHPGAAAGNWVRSRVCGAGAVFRCRAEQEDPPPRCCLDHHHKRPRSHGNYGVAVVGTATRVAVVDHTTGAAQTLR